ncbi:MAG: hypothetical protein ABI780_02630 [Ardenticatenales bacterium]
MQAILDYLNTLGPWGIVIGAILAIVAKKLPLPSLPAIGPLLSPTPATPTPSAPAPMTVADAAITIILGLARQKFPWLAQDAAVAQFASDLIESQRKQDLKDAAATVAAKPTS